jgi:superfamily II DNA or RNA helicase
LTTSTCWSPASINWRAPKTCRKSSLTHWDLVVVDEAHKLSASYFGNKINKTKRFQLGELLGSITRHFLLMTATPHNGKEEDFQLFMSLLDSDRFYGKFRDGAHKVDVTDLMRRMVKEDMLRSMAPAVPRAPCLHRQLQALRPRSRALRRRHRLREEELNRADQLADGGARARSASP